MTTWSTSCVFTELSPNSGYKEIVVSTPTAASGDTLAITLSDYGISSTSGLLGVTGWVQTTKGCIVELEKPTTAVSAGVLTITSASGTGKKIYKVLGKSN